MNVTVSEAKGQLTELVRRAEAGEEIVLTRHGHPVARLTAVKRKPTAEEKKALLESIRASAGGKAKPGPSVARSQDILYDEYGLPK